MPKTHFEVEEFCILGTGGAWRNNWRDENQQPMKFKHHWQAQAELDNAIEAMDYDPEEFRIVEITTGEDDGKDKN